MKFRILIGPYEQLVLLESRNERREASREYP